MNKAFEEIKLKNKRESNFSKRMDDNKNLDSEFMKETKEFYDDYIKPTVRKNYAKLLDIENKDILKEEVPMSESLNGY